MKTKTSQTSRRKFLTSVGLIAGAAAMAPSMKQNLFKNSKSLLDPWLRKSINQKQTRINPLRVKSRPPGSHLLPFSSRPF